MKMDDIILSERRDASSGKNRLVELDYARGFAIFLIVLYHTYAYTERSSHSIVYDFCHTVQLPMFFFISGVLIGKSRLHHINLKKKAQRLIIPFLFLYFTWCVINFNDIYNFLYDEFKGGYWFLLVLFEMMVISYISFRISDIFSFKLIYVFMGMLIILATYIFILPKSNLISLILSINLLWHYLPFYLSGFFYSSLKNLFRFKYLIVYVLLFVVFQYLLIEYNHRILIPLCNLSSLFLFVTLFFNGFRPLENFFSRLGNYSMQIYILHFFLLRFLADYIPIINNRMIEFFLFSLVSLVFIFIIIHISKVIMLNKWARLLFFGIT